MVFVFGSPRSGTTFLARAIGSTPGFVDLGEVAALKAEIPELSRLTPREAAPRIQRILSVTRRLALVGDLRGVEQTPEAVYVAQAVAEALPQAVLVHIVRDGRDVVCSLLERGWLSAGRGGEDDAGLAFGAHVRFWVEPDRAAEFRAASDVRRAAWAWRVYVTAARRASRLVHEVRYEQLSANPASVAQDLAQRLDAPAGPLEAALEAAYGSSVGRYRTELTAAQLEEVEDEAGSLLRDLGYLQ